MTASQIRANSPAGKIVLPRVYKGKDPFGYIEAAYYLQDDRTVREVILEEKGDTSNIRRPWQPEAGEERADYSGSSRNSERVFEAKRIYGVMR